MKRVVVWLDKHFEESIIITMLAVMTILTFIEVPKRYFWGLSSPYVDEICRILFIWMTFLGVPFAIQNKRHIVIDLLRDDIPPKAKLILESMVTLILLLFFSAMIRYSLNVFDFMVRMNVLTDAMMLPQSYFLSVIPIGFGLGIVRLIQGGVESFRGYRQGPDPKSTEGQEA